MPSMSEIIKKIEREDSNTPNHLLFRLLEHAMTLTGLGEVCEDYTQAIEFPLGDCLIYSDPYYDSTSVTIGDEEIGSCDEEQVQKLIKEVKKRLLFYEQETKTTRDGIVKKIFDAPVKIDL